jgi:glucokinase
MCSHTGCYLILPFSLTFSTYGSEVGCCALKWIPTGGIFVTGGIIGKLLKAYPQYIKGDDSEFMKAFYDKGRVSPILKDVPLFAVTVEDMGLRGARMCALRVSYILASNPLFLHSLSNVLSLRI